MEDWEEKQEARTKKLLHSILNKVEHGRWRQSWGQLDYRRGATIKLTRDECNELTNLICNELNWCTEREVERMDKAWKKAGL